MFSSRVLPPAFAVALSALAAFVQAAEPVDEVAPQIGDDPASWMSCFHAPGTEFDQHTLKEICVPGTHDSGAYQVLGGGFAKLASPWVVTQKLDLRGQLEAGARKFDLRVLQVSSDSEGPLEPGMYLHHGGVATVSLDDALAQIAAYLETETARTETVLLEFSHFRGLARGAGEGSAAAAFIAAVEKALGPHLHRRAEGDPPVIDLPLRELKGEALFLLATHELFDGAPTSAAVIPLGGHGLPIYDRYANRDLTAEMVADQSAKFAAFDAPAELFQLCWTLTPQKTLRSGAGVKKLATKANAQLPAVFADPDLPFARPNAAGQIVNVINVDFFGTDSCRTLETCARVMRAGRGER